ncbi:hypothetical protein [Acinetobacter pittii]|uniref:hypothetical protein n=1 Tax=Acinetobacter pittii TaxID=48296 RepID=UPI0023802F52|nr:hypothetical protein [Acinetobacter pittii]MDE4038307.1 hypothetical protein [Acinetobacter pittii]WPP88972.1 hypothetical protein SOI77_02775 [Acinetobacter pittii]
MKALKEWLKQQHEFNDLTQQQLAHKLRKPLQYIKDVEHDYYRDDKKPIMNNRFFISLRYE